MAEKASPRGLRKTVPGMLLLVLSGALLGAGIDFTDIVRGDDRALTRTAAPVNAGDTGIIPVTGADEQRLTRTCNLCEASHSQSGPQTPQPGSAIPAAAHANGPR